MTSSRLHSDASDVYALLVNRARSRAAPVTYAEVARHTGRIANGLGPLLDQVEYICAQRREPNLAVLVVNKTTGQPTKYVRRGDDWQAEQQRCITAWGPTADGDHHATDPAAPLTTAPTPAPELAGHAPVRRIAGTEPTAHAGHEPHSASQPTNSSSAALTELERRMSEWIDEDIAIRSSDRWLAGQATPDEIARVDQLWRNLDNPAAAMEVERRAEAEARWQRVLGEERQKKERRERNERRASRAS